MKIKIEKKEKQPKLGKDKKLKTIRVGTHKKITIFLWVLLIGSVSFGIYKNFTAIDMHTVHEREIVEMRVVDTNKVESFVENFAKIYYSWEQKQESIDKRSENLKEYLTEELQALNTDTIRADIPTSASVNNIQVWEVTQLDDHHFEVLFSVKQTIVEEKDKNSVESSYMVTVYVGENGDMVITKNPTISNIPQKADYTPKVAESDGTVDTATTEEINEFLETFFSLYPQASEKELSYYVKNQVLQPIGRDYLFVELVDPVYKKADNQVSVSVTVKYLDQQTKATQISQFELLLENENSGNWIITK